MCNCDVETEVESTRKGAASRVLAVVLIAVGAAGIVLAALVVGRNARRITLPEPKVKTVNVSADASFRAFRRDLRRRSAKVRRRFDKHYAGTSSLTPAQDSLAQECLARFSRLEQACAALDTFSTARGTDAQKRAAMEEYRALLNSVRAFVRTTTFVALPDLDSLDRELQKLTSE